MHRKRTPPRKGAPKLAGKLPRPGMRASGGAELVNRGVPDRGDGTGALGDEKEIELDELMPLLLEETLDPGAHGEVLAHARHAPVAPLALDVDPGADPHVATERAVRKIEVGARMRRRLRLAIERQRLAEASEIHGGTVRGELKLGRPQDAQALEKRAAHLRSLDGHGGRRVGARIGRLGTR